MRFISTRQKKEDSQNYSGENQPTEAQSTVGLSRVLTRGLAPDGGLYVPLDLPQFSLDPFLLRTSESDQKRTQQIAHVLLKPFFEGDPLESHLSEIIESAFSFPLPLKPLKNKTSVLELFHGPTSDFKDLGARFLAGCVQNLGKGSKGAGQERVVLVATSGDTGSAVAAAFDGLPNMKVIILYPRGMVSARQQRLLTCWSPQVKSFSVSGTFDDCQRMVKEALASKELGERVHFISANSINWGRLLPQIVYYAKASLEYYAEFGVKPGFVIPSGNLGNSFAAFMALKMGFPIRRIVLSCNANTSISHFFKTGIWQTGQTISTLANAMDVGSPSNMERFLYFKNQEALSLAEFKKQVDCIQVFDEQILKTIRDGEKNWGEVWCPHTATAVYAREQLAEDHWILAATAHPAKFEQVVESQIGHSVVVPKEMSDLLKKPTHCYEIKSNLAELYPYF